MNPAIKTQKRAFLIFFAALIILISYILKPFLMPLLLGSVIVVLFYPVYSFFLRLCRQYRYVASVLTTFLIITLFGVPVLLIGVSGGNQLAKIINKEVIPFIEEGKVEQKLKQLNVKMQERLAQLEDKLQVKINLKTTLVEGLKKIGQYLSANVSSFFVQGLGLLGQLFIALIAVFFLFVEGKSIYHEMVELLPLKLSHEEVIAGEIQSMIYSVFIGSFFTAFIQAILAGIGFLILGIEGALVWGGLTFLFAFIPLIGAGAIWVPASLFLILFGETWQWIFLLLYGTLVISMVDNFLKPFLMRGKSNIHPVLLFLSILGAINLIGPVGILIGPVTLAVFMAAIGIYKKDYLTVEVGTATGS